MILRIVLLLIFLGWWFLFSFRIYWLDPTADWMEIVVGGLCFSVLLPLGIFVIGLWLNVIAKQFEE